MPDLKSDLYSVTVYCTLAMLFGWELDIMHCTTLILLSGLYFMLTNLGFSQFFSLFLKKPAESEVIE